jgi:hypothetical protein
MVIQESSRSIYKRINRSKTVNSQLTKLIINYHELGFTEDFYMNASSRRLYLQRDQGFYFPFYTITVVNQCYDNLTKDFKYVHMIETICGVRGLLISPDIRFTS